MIDNTDNPVDFNETPEIKKSDAAEPVTGADLHEPEAVVSGALLSRRLGDKTETPIYAKLVKIVAWFLAGLFLFTVLQVLILRWVPPSTSAFIMARRYEVFMSKGKLPKVQYKWTPWKKISLELPLAVIAAEDQKFPMHKGFDFESISNAVETNKANGRMRGASTITQQVAKNLFLWQDKSYTRKALEAYYTVLLEFFWPKKRIIEVYINIAEFGSSVYGVGAASSIFFDKTPAKLSRYEAALLATVLPSPKRMRVKKPSAYMLKRVNWIVVQMDQLGDVAYVENL